MALFKLFQGLKKRLVVAKKLVVNDFWLVVNSDLASCKSQTKIASCVKVKNYIHVLCIFSYRDLTKSTSRSSLEIAIFKTFHLWSNKLQLIVMVINFPSPLLI